MQYTDFVYDMFLLVKCMIVRFRDLREDQDKTQEQIAHMLGCTQQAYSRYENRKAQMSYELLHKLADYYDTSVDYLLGRTDERRPYPPSTRGRLG